MGLGSPSWVQKCQDDPKMGQHDPQDRTKQGQDARKMAQLAPKLAQQGPACPPSRILRPPGDPPGGASGGIVARKNVEFCPPGGFPSSNSRAHAQGFVEKSSFSAMSGWQGVQRRLKICRADAMLSACYARSTRLRWHSVALRARGGLFSLRDSRRGDWRLEAWRLEGLVALRLGKMS